MTLEPFCGNFYQHLTSYPEVYPVMEKVERKEKKHFAQNVVEVVNEPEEPRGTLLAQDIENLFTEREGA